MAIKEHNSPSTGADHTTEEFESARIDVAREAVSETRKLVDLIWREVERGDDDLRDIRRAIQPRLKSLLSVAFTVLDRDTLHKTEDMQAVLVGGAA